MEKKSLLKKVIFKSSQSLRITVRLVLMVLVIWCFSILLLNKGTTYFQWFITDVEGLRVTLGSIFQGLASFFAIVVSVSLLVAQLAHGSFSPRLMPNFLRDRTFLSFVFLFIGTLTLNAILLSLLTEENAYLLIPLILLDLILSTASFISVIPVSFALLNSAHPMKIGWDLIERFNGKYFEGIYQNGTRDFIDDINLPPLQSLIIKSLREADTDYAQKLIGSLRAKLEGHITDDNAVSFANYFDSFFKKISFVASQENEEGVLQQIVFTNEALEKKAAKSKKYLSDTDTRYEASFARNILFVIELCIKNRHDRTLGLAQGAMWRLQEAIITSIPPDNEIADFRTILHLRHKNRPETNNQDIHYANERIFEYIKGVYFSSNSIMAIEALRQHNSEALHHFTRDIFRSRHSLGKLGKSTHREVIHRIAYSEFFNLSRISHLAIKNNINIAEDVAVGLQEAQDFLMEVSPKLIESYVDLLGQLMIEVTERDVRSDDPNTLFFWSGVVLRGFLHQEPANIPIKILEYFEKVLEILQKKQGASSNPMLKTMEETICEEIASVRNYKNCDATIQSKAEIILAKLPKTK
jgi:hypothetical protein